MSMWSSVNKPLQTFFIKALVVTLTWLKTRLSYLTNSWVYTTNHKRIAVNYFSFVLVSGTAGMGLATVVRLEFAYPGIGVLAGDSLQYLSVATAHGVIMVFFMIMPLIFGAFGNFLLPTQLGVHDVAFPRLNSAAFWFLPGGLLMLCQLVCIDRRYQRMNCFNIRELQGILKRKFFSDLTNWQDFHNMLDESMIGLRFKINNTDTVSTNTHLFYIYGLSNENKTKTATTLITTSNSKNIDLSDITTLNCYTYILVNNFSLILENLKLENFTAVEYDFGKPTIHTYKVLLTEVFTILTHLIYSFLLISVTNISISLRQTFVSLGFYLTNTKTSHNTELSISFNRTLTSSSNFAHSENSKSNNSLGETSDFRFIRFDNPLINYDYKCGNYVGIWDKLYPTMITTFIEVARGIKKPLWAFSEDFTAKLKLNFKLFNDHFTFSTNFNMVLDVDWYTNHITNMDNFFGVWTSSKKTNLHSIRWVSLNALDQKFQTMFLGSSTQQRILSNWKQLKFTREAWRCKLLAARHQNTMYRRFTNEDGVVWSIDRNARDLLPGWAMITPFATRTRFTAIGKTDIGLMGVLIVLNSSIVSSANFLVTYRYLSTLNNRKMRDARSFFAEGMIVASWMMIAANPMLVIGIVMLISDRHWQTSFFDYSGGGDTVLFQHMFWFFGHPEVYVIMIPVFGFTNTLMSYYLRKRVSARASLMYSMYTIAFLGFFVWGHHMYMVGLAHTTRMLFSTLTVMISVPAATKLMHWCVTLVNSSFAMELPFLFTLTFVFFFVSGGVSGMCVASTGMDVLFHDTFYVIGHFHVMFAGSAMLGNFAAFYFYFPAIFGVKYSRIYAYIHYVYYLFGQLLTVIPMLWLGYCGMPRRVLDYPSSLGGWHSIASAGHLLSVAAMLSFFIMIFDSIRQAKPSVRNTFGVSRFNTRLNFYLYEAGRLSFTQRKNFYNHRSIRTLSSESRDLNLIKFNTYETVLFSYQFFRK